MTTFLKNVLSLLNQKGVSRNKMLTDLHLGKNSFVNWENRETVPGGDTLNKIAEYFNVSTDYLLGNSIELDFVPHELEEDDNLIKCPICDHQETHFIRTRPISFANSKSDGIALEFWCEAEHTFYLIIETYKGNTYMVFTDDSCTVKAVPELPYENAPVPLSEMWHETGAGKYQLLDEYGKKAVDSILDIEYKRCISFNENATIIINYSTIPVSAGVGEFLDEQYIEPREFPDCPNARRADLVVSVSGDSMEPKYHDGDELYVRLQPAVEEGEIGIFMVNGKGYVKKYSPDKLISLNPDYEDIYPDEYTEHRCVGKVIGKV